LTNFFSVNKPIKKSGMIQEQNCRIVAIWY
jgi:hypothetical protein